MWNDWLSSLTGPSNEPSLTQAEIPEPLETPRRFTNPAQIERLQNLQAQHQQLQVQQLHLLSRQFGLQKSLVDAGDSTCTEGSSSGLSSPSSGVSMALAQVVRSASAGKFKEFKSEGRPDKETVDQSALSSPSTPKESLKTEAEDQHETEAHEANLLSQDVWQQFHALQAQQWAQALNQARIAKRQTGVIGSNGLATPLNGSSGVGLISSSAASGISGGKRCKAYAAPKGVWKNNGGYNATIYVHKRRIYGPIRRDLSDAIEDRKEMEEALRELTAIHNSPDDAAVLEVEMREVVAGLRNRSTPTRPDSGPSGQVSLTGSLPSSRLLSQSSGNVLTPSEGPRKRLRLVGSSSVGISTPEVQNSLGDMVEVGQGSPDVLGPFSAPMQIKPEDDHLLNGDHHPFNTPGGFFDDNHREDMMHHARGYTPNTGPIRDVYGSPAALLGLGSGLLDDSTLDMLPDPLSGGMGLWGN